MVLGKSKTNPNAICFCCKVKIANRNKNAKYCTDCAGDVNEIMRKLRLKLFYVRKYYPDYNITIKMDIKRNTIKFPNCLNKSSCS